MLDILINVFFGLIIVFQLYLIFKELRGSSRR